MHVEVGVSPVPVCTYLQACRKHDGVLLLGGLAFLTGRHVCINKHILYSIIA
jgi:hypothetical protein